MNAEPKKCNDPEADRWTEENVNHEDGHWEIYSKNNEWAHLITIKMEEMGPES